MVQSDIRMKKEAVYMIEKRAGYKKRKLIHNCETCIWVLLLVSNNDKL